MDGAQFFSSGLYTWFILPLAIFVARILDVSMGTIRVIFISKGLKYLSAIIGFFEILIWLLAIGQIMANLSNVACYVAYAGGFATGNFVGIWIAEQLSLGVVLVRVVTKKDATSLLEYLKSANYGVTSVNGEGSEGLVKVIFTIVPRREIKGVVDLIKKFNPKAFYSIEEIRFVEKGIFPVRKVWEGFEPARFFRPFRKGK